MKEKILSFLKTKLQGVPDNYLLGIAEHYAKTVTEEKQIETTFTDGVIDLLKLNAGLLQSEGDKRATTAAQTALKNFQDKHGLGEDGLPLKKEDLKKKKKEDTDPDEPAWFKTYRELKDAELAELKTKLETQEKEKTSASLIERVKKHDKLKDIPASFLIGRNLVPKSEGEIDNLVTEIRTNYDNFFQEQVEKGVIVSIPANSTETTKEGEKIGKDIAVKRNTNASEGVKSKKV